MAEQNKSGLVAKFEKALCMAPATSSDQTDDLWLVLGYFDTLRLCSLPREIDEYQIGAMWRANISISRKLDGNAYLHPLHMISRKDDAGLGTNREKLPYLFLSLVQGKETASLRKLESNLEEELSKRRGEGSNVRTRFYHTLELSDLIVISESDCMVDLLENLRRLHEDARVRDTDTFVAIRYTYLQKREWSLQGMPDHDQSRAIYVAIRYVVQNAIKKREFLSLKGTDIEDFLKDSVFFTTGIEDLHVVRNQVSVERFLNYLHAVLFNSRVAITFREAFSSSMTQIGLSEQSEDVPEPAAQPQPRNIQEEGTFPDRSNSDRMTECCAALLEAFRSMLTFEGGGGKPLEGQNRRDASWSKPAGNLYAGLLDMSRNSVLDGFCYLILDAAAVFCEELRRWCEQADRRPMSSRQLELVQRFVRGWGTLMEHTTRMDGRFIQMPGLTPSLCEIPARLLEFYLAVARLCVEQMQLGAEEGENVAFLLVPKICRRMKVESVFPNSNTGGNHLLYVDVPLDMLYDPTSVMCGICHEAAHFVGGKWRRREDRRRHLLLAVANELAFQLDLNQDNAVLQLYDLLDEMCPKDRESLYLRNLKARLRGVVRAFLESPEIFAEYLRRTLEDPKWMINLENRFESQMNALYRRNLLLMNCEMMLGVVDNLTYLFQECYADTSMISMFRLDRSAYLALARQELEELAANNLSVAQNDGEEVRQANAHSIVGEGEMASRYYVVVERWSALLRQKKLWNWPGMIPETFETWLERELENQTGVMKEFLEDIASVCGPGTWGKRDEKGGKLFNNSGSFKALMDYLESCCLAIQKTCAGNPAAEELQEVFRRMTTQPQLDYTFLEEQISWYRKKLLKEYQETLIKKCQDS